MICILLSLLAVPVNAQGNSFNYLLVDTMWIEGNRVANTEQKLHVVFRINSYYSFGFVWSWALVASEVDGHRIMNLGRTSSELIDDTKGEYTLKFKAPSTGTYHLHIALEANNYVFNGHNGLTATFVEQYEKPNLQVVYNVLMSKPSDEAGGPNTVYGSRICGTVEITNRGTQPYYCTNGLRIALTEPGDPETTYAQSRLEHGIEAGATITRDFCFDIPFSPNNYTQIKERMLSIVYTDDDGTQEVDDKYQFVIRRPANTYYTADGQVHDVPVGPGNQLQIPAEALAVDLRGQYGLNVVYTVDASKASPNCLFYLESIDPVPAGLDDQMVVQNYVLRNLTVNGGYDYYCPLPFYAVNAFFTYTPVSEQWGRPEDVESQTMSGTVTVPFDVQDVWLVSVNNVRVYGAERLKQSLSICQFLTDNDNQLVFEPVASQELKAYKPYLINSVLPSSITFYAEFLTIPATRKAVVHGNGFDFVGTTVGLQTAGSGYRWSCDNNCFYKCEENDSIRPFTAFMVPNGMQPEEGKLVFVNTGIDNVTGSSATKAPQAVYTLSGQCLGNADVKRLKPGLYIINGRKTVVK